MKKLLSVIALGITLLSLTACSLPFFRPLPDDNGMELNTNNEPQDQTAEWYYNLPENKKIIDQSVVVMKQNKTFSDFKIEFDGSIIYYRYYLNQEITMDDIDVEGINENLEGMIDDTAQTLRDESGDQNAQLIIQYLLYDGTLVSQVTSK